MRLTNERKVCAVVLTLALAALGVDRLFLGGGAPAAAAGAELLAPGAGNSDPAANLSAKPEQPRASTLIPVARQFVRLESHAGSTADGFSAPDQWRAAIELERARAEAARPAPSAVVKVEASSSDTWLKDKRLTAILRTSDRTLALINGRTYEVGDTLDGLVLTALDEKTGSAKFAEPSGENAVEIVIPRPDAAKPSR